MNIPGMGPVSGGWLGGEMPDWSNPEDVAEWQKKSGSPIQMTPEHTAALAEAARGAEAQREEGLESNPDGNSRVYRPEQETIGDTEYTQEDVGDFWNELRFQGGKAKVNTTKDVPTGGYLRPQPTYSPATGFKEEADGTRTPTGGGALIPDQTPQSEMRAARPDLLGADAAPLSQLQVNKSSNRTPQIGPPPSVNGATRAGTSGLQNLVTIKNAVGRHKAGAEQQQQQQATAGALRNG